MRCFTPCDLRKFSMPIGSYLSRRAQWDLKLISNFFVLKFNQNSQTLRLEIILHAYVERDLKEHFVIMPIAFLNLVKTKESAWQTRRLNVNARQDTQEDIVK